MSQLVKDIFMWFGISCGCFYFVLGLWALAQQIKDKLVNHIIKGVIDELKNERCITTPREVNIDDGYYNQRKSS